MVTKPTRQNHVDLRLTDYEIGFLTTQAECRKCSVEQIVQDVLRSWMADQKGRSR